MLQTTPVTVRAAPFRISFIGEFGFASDFEIRISDFAKALAPFRSRLRITK